jgi:hypothetical protein
LLAGGYSRFGVVPGFLGDYAAIQITRYSSGRSFWFAKRHHHAAWQVATAVSLVYRKAARHTKVCILFSFESDIGTPNSLMGQPKPTCLSYKT